MIASAAAREAGARTHDGGVYVCIEGPQFSTRAESNLYRSWGVDVIGMTNLQEAKLAREAEICYATMALVTDYDCWHETAESVSVEQILGYLKANAAMAQRILAPGHSARGATQTRLRMRQRAAVRNRHRSIANPGRNEEGPGADHREVRYVRRQTSGVGRQEILSASDA